MDDDRYGSAVIGRTDTNPWLFPGRKPGRPLSISRLKARLAAIGIIGRTARNTALIDLASQLPPAVLARLLGIDINTAGAWAERAARSGAAYPAGHHSAGSDTAGYQHVGEPRRRTGGVAW